MNRRVFLGTVVFGAPLFSGCLTEHDVDDSRQRDADDADDDSYEYPPTGYIYVYLAISVPNEETVYDAKEDDFIEVRHIERALETAKSEYDDGMEEEIEPEEETHWENKLAEISGKSVAEGDAGSKIGGDGVYVEYEGVMYVLLYDQAE